jgi:hypothetical protein
MSHPGSITGHELASGPAAVTAVNNIGTNTLLLSALGAVVKLAGDTTLPAGIRSLAAVVTCAIAVVIVAWVCRHERGRRRVGQPARRGGRAGRPGARRYAQDSPVQGMTRNQAPREDVRPHRPGGAVSSPPARRTMR